MNSGQPRNESAVFQTCVCSFVLVLMHLLDALSMVACSPLLDDMYCMSSWTESALMMVIKDSVMSRSRLRSSYLVLTAAALSVDLCDMRI